MTLDQHCTSDGTPRPWRTEQRINQMPSKPKTRIKNTPSGKTALLAWERIGMSPPVHVSTGPPGNGQEANSIHPEAHTASEHRGSRPLATGCKLGHQTGQGGGRGEGGTSRDTNSAIVTCSEPGHGALVSPNMVCPANPPETPRRGPQGGALLLNRLHGPGPDPASPMGTCMGSHLSQPTVPTPRAEPAEGQAGCSIPPGSASVAGCSVPLFPHQAADVYSDPGLELETWAQGCAHFIQQNLIWACGAGISRHRLSAPTRATDNTRVVVGSQV